jgi:soluble lytic murein transglycosylase
MWPAIRDNDAVNKPFAIVAVGCVTLIAALVAHGQSDADFLAAKSAYERGDARRLAALSPTLNGHVLEAYVEYWQLKLALDSAEPSAVRAYLTRYAGVPIADQLRVDWLKSQALRGQWTTFAQDYRQGMTEDTELACHAIQFRRQRDGESALAQAKPLWFTGRSTSDACEPLFAALIASGDLSVDERRARVRLASENGNTRLAQSIATNLPPADRIVDREFARVERDPAGALARGEFEKKAPGRELALYALERASRKDPIAARAAWVKFRAALPEPDRLYGNARLAFHAARQQVPDANIYYREAAATPLSDEQHAWRVRAALRAQSWSDVRAAVEAMPPAQKDEAAWRYWRARAQQVLGAPDDAKRAFETLAKEFHFYGLLAAEALGTTVDPTSQPVTPSPEVFAAFGARADVRRAVKLAELDMRMESIREWALIARGLYDEALLTAAEFAKRAGLNDRAINIADRTAVRHDFGLRYLMPYRREFEVAAREHAVDSALLFAIARQESRFSPDIVSSAGAQGLMQLMPATARWVATQLGEGAYRPAKITDIETNTRFGAFYFRYWLERLDSHSALAAAAYNAGPGRAQAWRPLSPLEGAAWVETIPFNETRDYVKKVLANAMFYTRALGKPAVPLTARLGVVTPRTPSTATSGSVAVN